MRDALEVWQKHGKAALEDMAINDRSNYVKAMVVALPKNVLHQTASEELDNLTTEETRELLDWIRTMKAKTIEASCSAVAAVADREGKADAAVDIIPT